ncbi:hypothetical protein DIRU0_E06436 [Diutina rugosa]
MASSCRRFVFLEAAPMVCRIVIHAFVSSVDSNRSPWRIITGYIGGARVASGVPNGTVAALPLTIVSARFVDSAEYFFNLSNIFPRALCRSSVADETSPVAGGKSAAHGLSLPGSVVAKIVCLWCSESVEPFVGGGCTRHCRAMAKAISETEVEQKWLSKLAPRDN